MPTTRYLCFAILLSAPIESALVILALRGLI